jgi:hypothetical protein
VVHPRSLVEGVAVALIAACTGSLLAVSLSNDPKPAPAPATVSAQTVDVVQHARRDVVLSRPRTLSRYAFVERRVGVRSRPTRAASTLAALRTRTQDRTDELVLVMRRRMTSAGRAWVKVRAPLLRQPAVGWIPQRALSRMYRVRTWLIVDRRRLRATLMKRGRVVMRAPVGIGTEVSPTPAGGFYVRDRFVELDPGGLYGPIAFGTSARSRHVTDWPGGSMVGIHGTNRPDLIPGRVSHGCVRLRNRDIRRLSRRMPVGTPVTIR